MTYIYPDKFERVEYDFDDLTGDFDKSLKKLMDKYDDEQKECMRGMLINGLIHEIDWWMTEGECKKYNNALSRIENCGEEIFKEIKGL